MTGVYESCDVSMAVDLFEWSYRRSQARYKVVLESMGSPDPFRIRHRETLNEAVDLVVRRRMPLAEAMAGLVLPDEDALKFRQLISQELDALAIFNCARYRLSIRETQAWIDDGRPR